MMPPFVVFPTNRIAHFVEVSLYLFYLAQQVILLYIHQKVNVCYLIIVLTTFLLLCIDIPVFLK